jgi:16S rRNA (guanine527-N7)-methyltransferase
MHPLEARLHARAEAAALTLDAGLVAPLLAYYDLLARWNSTINLTSLSDPDEAIDRLLLEPLAAAAHLPRPGTLMDLGSGGGSPAIPLALALKASSLVMVESKGRKAAFLREAARLLHLHAIVEAVRVEDLAASGRFRGEAQVVSMRAVRMDGAMLGAAASFLAPTGQLALFVSAGTTLEAPARVAVTKRAPLLPGSELLTFHVEQ